MASTCSVRFSGVSPSLGSVSHNVQRRIQYLDTDMLAFMIHSSSSSPSSGPDGPPFTLLKRRG
jgi:hypothetical protein